MNEMKELVLFKGMDLIDLLWLIERDDKMKDKTLWIMENDDLLFMGKAEDIEKVIGVKFWLMKVVYIFSDNDIHVTVKEVK